MLGIRYARNLPQQWLNRFVIVFGVGIAAYYALV